jgi:hypothetical protein
VKVGSWHSRQLTASGRRWHGGIAAAGGLPELEGQQLVLDLDEVGEVVGRQHLRCTMEK